MSAPGAVTQIAAADVPALYAGANFHSPAIGESGRGWLVDWLAGLLEETGPIPLLRPESLDPHAWCAAMCVLGSGSALTDLPPTGDEFVESTRMLEHAVGQRLSAVYPLAAATVSALFPVAAAAQLGVPLMDCDGMGRAFAQIHQTAMYLSGVAVAPAALVGATGEGVLVRSTDDSRADQLCRASLDVLGGWGALVGYPSTVQRAGRGALRGTVSRLLAVGRLLVDPVDADLLLSRLSAVNAARRVGRGRIVELEHLSRRADMTVPTHPTSVVIDDVEGAILRLELRSEVVAVFSDGVMVAAAPDLITLFDVTRGGLATLDNLEHGDLLDVLVTPAEAVWYGAAGLAMVGPSAHGIPLDHPRRRDR